MKKIIYFTVLAMVSLQAVAVEKADTKASLPTAEKATSTVEKKIPTANSDIRKPTGDIEKFWDDQDWKDLSNGEKKLWMILGWNEVNWSDESVPSPASDKKTWAKLSLAEQAAATALGYSAKYWDSILTARK